MRRERNLKASLPHFLQRFAAVRLLSMALICSSVMWLPEAGFGQDVRLTDDAAVSTAQPNGNFGSAPTLIVQTGSARAFVKFDLSALPSGTTGSSVAKATLQ